MVWLNFERPKRQAEGERYKSFNNLFKRPEKRQPRGTNSVSPRTRTPLTPAWRTCSGPGPITLAKFLFDGILIFCLDDFLATFTFGGLWRFPWRKWNMSKPITKKSKFKYLGRVSSNTHNPCRSEAGAHKHSSACRLVMSLFDGEAICGSPSIRYRSNLTLDCLYSGGMGEMCYWNLIPDHFCFFFAVPPPSPPALAQRCANTPPSAVWYWRRRLRCNEGEVKVRPTERNKDNFMHER